jgi:glutamine amidotransferase-like uncharacterized protein
VVFRDDSGPAGCSGCADAVAALLSGSKWGFTVKFVGPKETEQLSASALKGALLYAQPGGNGSVDQAFTEMQSFATTITSYVSGGGRYIGFCEGGYLAGRTPGFDLLPGDANEFVGSTGADVPNTNDTVVDTLWRGAKHYMYFQDGPYFVLDPGASVTVLGAYASNGAIAALVASYGSGKVAVVGPHPEADTSWYAAYGLTNPDGVSPALGDDLIDELMK